MLRFLLLLFMLLNLTARAAHQRISLQEALDRGMVSGKGVSRGGYQAWCMNLLLRNRTRDSLMIVIEPGRRLRAAEDPLQDILIVRREFIALKGREERSVEVKGYCCQAGDRAPANGAVYHLNRMADSNLVKVARFLDSAAYDVDAEQHAVWAISDQRPTAAISGSCDSLQLPLRQRVADLKGEELPWYTLLTKTHVFRSGAMLNIALALRGRINYENSRAAFATCTIRNEAGIPVVLVKRQWLNAAPQAVYELDIPVKELPPGKYAVSLESEGSVLAERKFEI